jgi:stage II sporulation protein R
MLLVEQGGLKMNRIQHNNKKLWVASLCLGLAVTLICQCTLLSAECTAIRNNLVRLHILANSDSQTDQALKIKVRDALLSHSGGLFAGYTTKEEAIGKLEGSLDKLTQIAQETLEQEGCCLPVTCQLEETYFNTRVYDTVTLPAGNYTALRVLIGKGAGQNWWCVMFPPLCIPAAQEVTAQTDGLEGVLTQKEQDLVTNGPRYQMKFKVVEWAEKAKQWLGF